MQPCDLRLFSSLKTSWKQAVQKFQDRNPGDVVTKYTFAQVFRPAWTQSARPELAIGAFRDSGLFPFNPSKVMDSLKLKPSQLFSSQRTIPSQPPSSLSSSSSPTLTRPVQPSFTVTHPAPSTSSSEMCPATSSTSSRLEDRKPSSILGALDLAIVGPTRKSCCCGALFPLSCSGFSSTSPSTTTLLPNHSSFASTLPSLLSPTTSALPPLPSSTTSALPSLPSPTTAALPPLPSPTTTLPPPPPSAAISAFWSPTSPTTVALPPLSSPTIAALPPLPSPTTSALPPQLPPTPSDLPPLASASMSVLPPLPSSSTSALPPLDSTPSSSAASFLNIPFPRAAPPKTQAKRVEKLPKAATGKAFRLLLEEKKKKKEEELQAKEERKRLREEKKRKADEEKQRKKEEREMKKRRKQMLVQQMTQELEMSDDELTYDEIDINSCFKCEGRYNNAEASLWIGCNRCPRWYHRSCIDVDLSGMSEEDIEELQFECLFC